MPQIDGSVGMVELDLGAEVEIILMARQDGDGGHFGWQSVVVARGSGSMICSTTAFYYYSSPMVCWARKMMMLTIVERARVSFFADAEMR